MDERRKYISIPSKLEISYNIIPTATVTQDATSDISQGGIRFVVHQFIPKDSRLKVRLTFDVFGTTIEALVRLVWIKELPHSDAYEIGVQFIDIPREAADHLINYIKLFVDTQPGPARSSK